MRTPLLPFLLASCVGLVHPGGAEAAKKPPLCREGRYLLRTDAGSPVAPGMEAFEITDRLVSLGACGPARGESQRTRKGTKINARWKRCDELHKFELQGTVSPDCARFTGTVRAKGLRKQAVTGRRSAGCGDGMVDHGLGESCDVGAPCGPTELCSTACACQPAPTTTTSSSSSTTTTDVTSTTTTTSTTLPPSCGNGVIESGEACDDGNESSCDGCTACQVERCGDMITCAGAEQCDDGNLTAGDGCSDQCELEGTTCLTPVIGTRTVTVSIDTPSPLAGIQVLLEYPQLQSSVPGTGTSSLVQSRVRYFPTPTAGSLSATAGDNDTDMTFVVYAPGPPGTEFITSGRLLAVDFDNCVAVTSNICNRAQTVVDCCNDPGDPKQFNNPNFCNGTSPTIACPSGFDTDCPARVNANCTGAATPFACCTGAGAGSCDSLSCTGPGAPVACCTGSGTGNCEAIQLGCTADSQPSPCCTGSGQGNCAQPTKGSCNVKCPGNPPVCAVNFSVVPNISNFSDTVVGPCQGKVCSNNATRACNVDGDCVPPGTCTGTQQTGACPGDNVCVPQAGPNGLTRCFVIDPVNALGQPVAGVTCSVTVQG